MKRKISMKFVVLIYLLIGVKFIAVLRLRAVLLHLLKLSVILVLSQISSCLGAAEWLLYST